MTDQETAYYAAEITDADLDAIADAGDHLNQEACAESDENEHDDDGLRTDFTRATRRTAPCGWQASVPSVKTFLTNTITPRSKDSGFFVCGD